jgi:uncharacterized membrane protein HdeD (DUF308 family)
MHHHIMSKFWWILVLRGVLGILLGLTAIVWILALDQMFPELLGSFLFLKVAAVLNTLIFLLGLYAFMDGSFAVLLGAQDYGSGRRWWTLIAEGSLSVGLGFLAWLWTEQAVLILLYWIGVWAVVTGFLEIVQAFDLNEYKDRRRFYFFVGSCSMVFGLSILSPWVGGPTLVWLMGLFAFSSGIPILALGLRLRRFAKRVR